jgi:hypothetical protein
MVSRRDPLRWAQTGYDYRNPRDDAWLFAWWTDVNGADHYRWDGDKPGSDTHWYECLQNATTGKWSFKYDGTEWAASGNENTAWLGDRVDFMGEVRETNLVQMPGDEEDKVKFSYFRWYIVAASGCVGGGKWLTIWPDVWHEDGPNDWGIYFNQSQGYFKIWDMNP